MKGFFYECQYGSSPTVNISSRKNSKLKTIKRGTYSTMNRCQRQN